MTLAAPEVSGKAILLDMHTSGGDPRDLTELQRARLRTLFTGSLYEFAWSIAGAHDLDPAFHTPMCSVYERWGTPGWRRLMVQVPRGAFKTTLITICGPLWLLVRDPRNTIAIFNASLDTAKTFMQGIDSIVRRSRLFSALWSDLLPPGIGPDDPRSLPKSWPFNTERMLFQRDTLSEKEVSISAFGIGAASAGHHWSHLIFDDLIGVEAAQSQTVMQQVKDWFDTSIYLGPAPETLNGFIACTRWRFDDVYEYARKKHNYRLYRRAALENGESTFPGRWTTEYLHNEQERDPYTFACQMQNLPQAGRDQSFNPVWRHPFRIVESQLQGECAEIDPAHYNPTRHTLTEDDLGFPPDPAPRRVPLSHLTKTLLVDPAPSTETDRRKEPNARTAMVMLAKDAWGREFMLDLWAGREEPVAICRRILRMLAKWGTNRLGIEEVVFSKVYAPFVRYIAQQEFPGTHIHYMPLDPARRDKDTRIQGRIPRYESGLVYLNTPVMVLHAEEYLTYPYGSTRDMLDAEAYANDPGVLPRPETPGEVWEREDADMGYGVGEDLGVTGYGD